MPREYLGPEISGRNRQGYWQIYYREDGQGRRASTGETDRRAANAYFNEWLEAREKLLKACAAPAEPAALGPPTVREVIERYLEGKVAKNELTKARDKWAASGHHLLAHRLAAKSVDDLMPEDAENYAKERAAGRLGWTDETGKRRGFHKGGNAAIRNDLLFLNSALRWAVKYRQFKGRMSLAELHPVPVPVGNDPKVHWLTWDETDRLLPAAQDGSWRQRRRHTDNDAPFYIFVMLGLHTAARMEAICQLEWSRVIWRRRPNGQIGGKVDYNVPGRRKTKKRRAIVEMSTELATALSDYWEAQGKPKTGFVLGSDTSMEWRFRRLCKNILGQEEGPHIMRHTWATRALAADVNLAVVANILGDTVETVTRVYAHHIPETTTEAVDLVATHRPADVIDLTKAREKR